MLDNAREEWDRAHHSGATVMIPYKDYVNLLQLVGLSATIMEHEPPMEIWDAQLAEFDHKIDEEYQKRAAEPMDKDFLCEEDVIILDESELEPLPDCYDSDEMYLEIR